MPRPHPTLWWGLLIRLAKSTSWRMLSVCLSISQGEFQYRYCVLESVHKGNHVEIFACHSCKLWGLITLDDIMLHRFSLPGVRCCRNTLILNPPTFHYYCTKHSMDTTLESHTFKISLWELHNCDFVMRVYELAQLRKMIHMCNNYILLHTNIFFYYAIKTQTTVELLMFLGLSITICISEQLSILITPVW